MPKTTVYSTETKSTQFEVRTFRLQEEATTRWPGQSVSVEAPPLAEAVVRSVTLTIFVVGLVPWVRRSGMRNSPVFQTVILFEVVMESKEIKQRKSLWV